MRDAAIVAGTGAGQPLRIINSNALIQVPKETGQLADTIVAENVINMYSRMTAQGKRRAVWLVNGECWPQLFSMALIIGTTGIPLYMPPGGMSASPYGLLLGRPVIEVEQCEALGEVGDIIFADLGQYLLIEKASGIHTDVSMHIRFLSDEMAYRFTYRCDGQPVQRTAITPYKGAASRSGFVALAAR